jgi:hypothetical protein
MTVMLASRTLVGAVIVVALAGCSGPSGPGGGKVAKECPDAWFTWVPPNLSCDEFEARF